MNSDLVPGDPLLGKLTRYAVGFLKDITDERGSRHLLPCGSGALISVGGIKGVLTAAHVILDLAKGAGKAALFRVPRPGKKAPRLEFNLSDCQLITIGGKNKNPDGPDLGFLRLPYNIEEHLRAEANFYNFDRRWREIQNGDEGEPLDHTVIVGVIAERSHEKEVTDTTKTDVHVMTHAYCGYGGHRDGAMPGFDVFDLTIHHSDDVPIPEESYGGLSGAAIWNTNNHDGAVNRVILGVAFFETDKDASGNRTVICHGPSCLYREFVSEIEKKFPEFKIEA